MSSTTIVAIAIILSVLSCIVMLFQLHILNKATEELNKTTAELYKRLRDTKRKDN